MEDRVLLESDTYASKVEERACKYYTEERCKKRYELDLLRMKGFWEDRNNLLNYLKSKGVSSTDEYIKKYGEDAYDNDDELERLSDIYEDHLFRFMD